ncbi:MAG TPA: MFS transporter [Gemmatimonadetes bacterium]|nr:MFS transporter [Gemmatimonadota bacterium]
MELLVLFLLLREITGSYFQLGLLAVFLNTPRPFLSLFSGVIADRLDRRLIMVAAHWCYFGIAVVILVLLIANALESWHVFIVVFLQGLAKVLDDPSRRTAMFDLVGAEHIANAVALEQGTSNIGKIIGPLAGGFLIHYWGFTGGYAVLVVLDLAALVLIVPLKLPQPRARLEARLEGGADSPYYEYIAHSVRSMLPEAERQGLGGFTNADADTLERRLRDEVLASRGMLVAWPVVAAFCRTETAPATAP